MHTRSRFISTSARRSLLRRRTVFAMVGFTSLAVALACSDRQSVLSDSAQSAPETFAARPASGAAAIARDESVGLIGSAAGRVSAKVGNEALADGAAQQAPAPAAPPAPTTPVQAVSQTPATSSMIIRTGFAAVEVDSLDSAIARVRALAQRVGGFVANTAVQGGKDQLRSASLEVKIPSTRFDEALAGLAPIGKVESVNVNAQDVGEEYVDIAARVENARRLEARLISLLATRTGRLQDVLSVERELARIREEIERYEGRMRYLRTHVAMSTLTINVHERAPIIVPVAGDGPIVNAFRQAWRNFVGLVAALIASLGVVIPLGVLAFIGWLVARRWAPWRGLGGAPPASGSVSGD